MEKQSYNFKTALSMVVGIVIGSGIFFKADDILAAVNGNVMTGILGFVIVGLGVLFGALTIAHYAINDKEHIGIIGYSRTALGSKFAYIVGWFSIACYFPAFILVLASVGTIYIKVLLGIDSALFGVICTALLLASSFLINIKSPEAGGKVQVILTVAKIIPLIMIGLIGTLFFSDSASIQSASTDVLTGGSPLSALIAIAFAFDGWIVATNISRELQDSERNLPRALAFGSIGIVIIYCLYFFGISQIVDPAQIVELGDKHTEVAAQAILGPVGAKVIIMFVIISVYGGLNGMTLAYLRLPRIFVDSKLMKNIYGKTETEIERGTILFCIAGVAVYYVIQQLLDFGIIFANLDSPFDLSALPIMINYFIYIVLFLMANRLVKNETAGKRAYYLIISLLATATAIVVIYGTMLVNGGLYIIFSIIVTIIGIPFINKESLK